jgi:hypothetical protein
MTITDPTILRLVHTVAGAEGVVADEHAYTTAEGPLPFRLYRPTTGATPLPTGALVIVSGFPDPGMKAFLGKVLQDWAGYIDWARAIAASGVPAITYENRAPADVHVLVQHLRANAAALGLDPARVGVLACSGNVPTALGVVARERLACAALLYGLTLDLPGETAMADAAKQFHFAIPDGVGIDDLPVDTPMLFVRAGKDATPGLDPQLQRFVAALAARGTRTTVLTHADGPHSFDLVDDSPETHRVIDEILRYLVAHLG